MITVNCPALEASSSNANKPQDSLMSAAATTVPENDYDRFVDEDGNEILGEVNGYEDDDDNEEIDKEAVESEVDIPQIQQEVAAIPPPSEWITVDPGPLLSRVLRSSRSVEQGYWPFYFRGPVGPKNIPSTTETPGDYMDLFFDDQILGEFVKNTNSYASKAVSYKWEEMQYISIAELKQYFGIILYMGIFHYPERSFHWSTGKCGSTLVQNVMNRTRFEAISSNLHWLDTSEITDSERKERNKADAFWTVQPFLELLSENFRKYYSCGQCLNIDEMCVFFKGRHRCRCYNPNKPNKWHFKVFCINESESGYLWSFYIYRGKDELRPPDVTASMWLVMNLTRYEELHGQNHVVSLDNWYTSISAVELLHSEPRKMHCVGTVRTNKKGLPTAHIFKASGPNKKARGFLECLKHSTKSLWFTAWMDTRPVHTLSTWEPKVLSAFRNTKTAAGEYCKLELNMPSTIKAYNLTMGGTDLCDQMTSYYNERARVLRWQTRIIHHFLLTACSNAKILYNFDKPKEDQLTLLQFMLRVIEEWTTKAMDEMDEEETLTGSNSVSIIENAQSKHRSWWEKQTKIRCHGSHFPRTAPTHVRESSSTGESTLDRIRKKCKLCSKKVSTFCSTCKVFLCLGNEPGRGCYEVFHQDETFA